VNKRIRILEKLGYISQAAVKETKAGFKAYVYELGSRAYLALLLNSINLDELLIEADEFKAQGILMAVIDAWSLF
jgi:hypothetical protein